MKPGQIDTRLPSADAIIEQRDTMEDKNMTLQKSPDRMTAQCLTLALCGCFDSGSSLNDMQKDESKGLTGVARGANALLPTNE